MGSLIEHCITRGIIEPAELQELLEEDVPIKILDGSFVLPTSNENPRQNFHRKRIANAQFFDIQAIANPNSDLPHMLPSENLFAQEVGKLGIGNDDFIVVYGQSGMVMGPARVWWTFRSFGHNNICVLNGGLPAWIKDGHEVNTNPPQPIPPAPFTATAQSHMVCDIEHVKQAVKSGTMILDARPANRYSGETAEPRPGMRAGHIPTSQNLPCVELINQETGRLKEREDLENLFRSLGYRPGAPLISSCGSGITACMIALALFHLQHSNISVYDGSWSEWGREDSNTEIATTV